MQRARQDTRRELVLDLRDDNGTPIVDATGITVTVVDELTTPIPGSPFTVAAEDLDAPKVELPAASLGALGVLTLGWTVDRPAGTEHRRASLEVVSGYLYELGELRDRHAGDYADPERWSTERLRANRDLVEDLFDYYCSPALRRRGRTVVLDGTNCDTLELPDVYPTRIVAVSIDDEALAGDELDGLVVYDTGHVRNPARRWPAGARNITVRYEHGLADVPADIHEAALQLARATLTTPQTPDRATSISTDQGNYRLTVAGQDGATGYPTIDAALNRWGARRALHAY